jgi:hypothetical protein
LNLGIFLLAGVGAYLLFRRPGDAALGKAAILYGIGLGLTFDEFGMWLHLGGGYWQRASLDAVLLIASSLALFILAPRVKELRPRHWWAAAGLLVMTLVFALLLVDSLRFLGRVVEPRMEHLEESAPGQP